MSRKKDNYNITLDKAWSLSKEWCRAAIIWRTLDHLFVLGSFGFSMATVYVAAEVENANAWIIALSALSGILSMTGFACNPVKYMTNYRAAFQLLNEALVENTDEYGRLSNGPEGRRAIKRAIKKAEQYIGRTFEIDLEPEEEKNTGREGNEEQLTAGCEENEATEIHD